MAVSCKKNQVISFCDYADVLACDTPYCMKYEQTDSVSFQVNLSEYNGEELAIGGDMDPVYSGTATATVSGSLFASGVNFGSLPYDSLGWTVKNTTDDTYATITGFVSAHEVTLSSDIFVSGEDFEILPFTTQLGILEYDETNNNWTRPGASTFDYFKQANILKVGHYYKATFDLTAVIGGAGVYLEGSSTTVEFYEETGTYTTYFVADDVDFVIINSGQVTIDNLTIKLMSSPGLVITDCDGNEVFSDDDNTYITYFEGEAGKGEAQVDFLWSELGLSDGVYNVCVTDRATLAASLIENGDFEYFIYGVSDNPYTLNKLIDGAGQFQTAAIPIGSHVHNLASNTDDSLVVSVDSETQLTLTADTFPLGAGDDYYITHGWKIVNVDETGGFGVVNNWDYGRVFFDPSASGTYTLEPAVFPTMDATKSYQLQILFTDETALLGGHQLEGEIKYDTATTSGNVLGTIDALTKNFTIEGIAMTRIYIETNETGTFGIEYFNLYELPSCQMESQCVALGDHTGTILLTWTNDQNFKLSSTDYINYEDFSYTQKLRVEGMFKDPTYEKEKEVFKFSNGVSRTIYSQSEEIRRLTTERLPMYLHRALGIGIEHDTFTVNGVQYVNEEDSYSPGYVRSSALAPVIIELVDADQRNENVNC